jgi:hypothetical protein
MHTVLTAVSVCRDMTIRGSISRWVPNPEGLPAVVRML